MKPEIKKKWVAALRSGKYKQGTMSLKKGNKFCCLGVLCDIYAKKYRVKWSRNLVTVRSLCGPITGHEFFGEVQTLPIEVAEWAELKADDIGYGPFSDILEDTLAGANDEGKTFAEIANAIEIEL